MPDTTVITQLLAQIGTDIKAFADQASADLLAAGNAITPQERAQGVAFVAQLRTLQGDVAAAGMVAILAGSESDITELQGGTAQLKVVLQQVRDAEMQLQFLAIWVPAVGSIIGALGRADVGGAFSAFDDASKAWSKIVHPDAAPARQAVAEDAATAAAVRADAMTDATASARRSRSKLSIEQPTT